MVNSNTVTVNVTAPSNPVVAALSTYPNTITSVTLNYTSVHLFPWVSLNESYQLGITYVPAQPTQLEVFVDDQNGDYTSLGLTGEFIGAPQNEINQSFGFTVDQIVSALGLSSHPLDGTLQSFSIYVIDWTNQQIGGPFNSTFKFS